MTEFDKKTGMPIIDKSNTGFDELGRPIKTVFTFNQDKADTIK